MPLISAAESFGYPTAHRSDPARRAAYMRHVLEDVAASQGSCTEDDLRRAGFSEVEIIEHLPDARSGAARRSIKRVRRQ